MEVTILDLDRDAIENPTRMHVAILEAAMLWPDDEASRLAAMRSSAVEFFSPTTRDMDPDEIEAFVEMAREAPPIRMMRQEAAIRFRRGVVAGLVLRECVGHVSVGKEVKLSSVFDRLVGEEKVFGLTKKIFDNDLWPKFRPVAHFWASYVASSMDDYDRAVPCAPDRLKEFLEVSEGYRVLGEQCRTKQSPKPLIGPGEAIRLPERLSIESRVLTFEATPKK